MNDGLGKKAEQKIRTWLNRPQDGYSFDRIPDQMSGLYGSANICDFICYKWPNLWYIESKATEMDRFDFSRISEYQMEHLRIKSKIPGVYAVVIVLYAMYKRTFMFNVCDIYSLIEQGKKSLNITKIDKWIIPYAEIPTIASKKILLDYTGDLDSLIWNNR